MEAIQTQVSYVERALKLVSDELTSVAEDESPTLTDAAAAPTAPTAPTTTAAAAGTAAGAPQRMLKGVMRVGLLAKGLLLKGDRTVQLVVLCSQAPTFELLDNVAKALPAHLTVS